jgi:hypothetical protein
MECADRRIVIRGSRLRCTCWSPSSGSYLNHSARLYRASFYGCSHFVEDIRNIDWISAIAGSAPHRQRRTPFNRSLLWVAHVGARQLLDVAVLQPRTVGILVWLGVHEAALAIARLEVCLRVARSNILPLTDVDSVSPRCRLKIYSDPPAISHLPKTGLGGRQSTC